jgi:hypothetical protein
MAGPGILRVDGRPGLRRIAGRENRPGGCRPEIKSQDEEASHARAGASSSFRKRAQS